jgi:hypothetical protein
MKKLPIFISIVWVVLLVMAFTYPDYVGRIHKKIGGERYINEQVYYRNVLWDYYRFRNETIKDSTIIFFGDSRINSVSVESNFCAVNYGISGETLKTAINEIPKFNNLKGKTIVLGYGINDNQRQVIDIYNDFKKLLEILKGCEVFILEVLPVDAGIEKFENNKVNELNQLLKSLPNYIPIDNLKKNGFLIHTYDGVHLTPKGNDILLKQLKDKL